MKNGCLVLAIANSVSAVIEILTSWNIFSSSGVHWNFTSSCNKVYSGLRFI